MVEYMEFLPLSIALAAATFSESVVNVPTPRLGGGSSWKYSRGQEKTATAMVIHAFEYELPTNALVDAADDYIHIQFTKQSKSAEAKISDGDVLDKFCYDSVGVNVTPQVFPVIHKYEKPILVVGQKIFLGQMAKQAFGTMHIRIHYTMREVLESDLVRASVV